MFSVKKFSRIPAEVMGWKFARRALLYAALAILALLSIFGAIRFGFVFAGWKLYGSIFNRIRTIGLLPDSINGAIAVWFVAIILILGPTIISYIFLGNTKKRRLGIIWCASIVSVWMVFLYFLGGAQPKKYLLNPFTKEGNYNYWRDKTGKIHLIDRRYAINPENGVPVYPMDPIIANEYAAQETLERKGGEKATIAKQGTKTPKQNPSPHGNKGVASKPLAPARPEGTGDEGNNSPNLPAGQPMVAGEKKEAEPRAHYEETPWLKPISGDEGALEVRANPACQYVNASRFRCSFYFRPTAELEHNTLYLNQGFVNDDKGQVVVGVASFDGKNTMRFRGNGGYPVRLTLGSKTYMDMYVDGQSGVQSAAIQIQISDGFHGWTTYEFMDIPVSLN